MRGQLKVSLSPGTRGWVNAVGLGLWASGAGWLVLHYFGMHASEFGPEPSAFEPWWLKAHGALAFLSLWTFGLLWGQHIVKAWGRGERRWTGSIMVAALLTMILTGYLLYYAPAGGHELISAMHWVPGLALPVAYLAHRLLRPVRHRPLARHLAHARPGAPADPRLPPLAAEPARAAVGSVSPDCP